MGLYDHRGPRVADPGVGGDLRDVVGHVVAGMKEVGQEADGRRALVGGVVDGLGDRGAVDLEVGGPHVHARLLGNGRADALVVCSGGRVAAAVGDQEYDLGHGATVRSRTMGDNATAEQPAVGVGPHPRPWPDDPRLDPELLADGDRRKVVHRVRYRRLEAIVEELDRSRFPFHVGVENWQHDLNIGTVVRNANAFGAAAVHIVGRRRWNRRGAMVTDRYQHVLHHADAGDLVEFCRAEDLEPIGIDNLPGSVPLGSARLPERAMLVFGQEGPGLSAAMRAAVSEVCSITMYGSTRSINAGVASGIAMCEWLRQHPPPT